MISINDYLNVVKATLIDLYQPRAFVTNDNKILISIGHEDRGILTLDELTAVKNTSKGFVELLRTKTEKSNNDPSNSN